MYGGSAGGGLEGGTTLIAARSQAGRRSLFKMPIYPMID